MRLFKVIFVAHITLLCAQVPCYCMNNQNNANFSGQCSVQGCSYTTTSLSALEDHMRTHSLQETQHLDDPVTMQEPAKKKRETEEPMIPMTPLTAEAVLTLTNGRVGKANVTTNVTTNGTVAQQTVFVEPAPRVIGNSYTCAECKGIVKGYKNFLSHKRTHKDLLFKCSQEGCDYAAATSSDLAKHMRTHTGQKPFKCSQEGCDYAATRGSDLTRHMRTHTGQKPFKCSQEGCDYAATQSSHLTSHMLTHTRQKPFKCSQEGCDYAATTSSGLTIHMRTHTGQKPFTCSQEGCDYAATTSSGLTIHMRTHIDAIITATTAAPAGKQLFDNENVLPENTEVQPVMPMTLQAAVSLMMFDQAKPTLQASNEDRYICEQCLLPFIGVQAFLVHKITHTPGICPVQGCGYTTTSNTSLLEHIKSHNNVTKN